VAHVHMRTYLTSTDWFLVFWIIDVKAASATAYTCGESKPMRLPL